MQCMIFAAGMGTRLRPLTDTMPKALVPIGGVPLLERLLLKLKAQGFTRVVVNVHHFGEQIIDFLRTNNNFGLDVAVSDERAQLLDTGGGLLKAADFFSADEPILIHNVDILNNLDLASLMRAHVDSENLATLVVSERTSSRYLLFDSDMRLHGWTNVKTGETIMAADALISNLHRYAFAGIHVVNPKIFGVMHSLGFNGAFPIMSFYLKAMNTQTIKGYAPDNLKIMDVGKIGDIEDAHAFAAGL